MAKTPPELQAYKKQEDSPYVAHARNLMETGYKGMNDTIPRIDVMNENTQNDINSRLGDIYGRAKNNFDIDYRDAMGETMAENYGRFGTTNGTPSLYREDMTNRTAQRKLADLAYNKAENYETDVDIELQRRYNAMNMYKGLYGYGQIPQQYDDQNYKMDLTNQDRAYQNDFNSWKGKQQTQQALTNGGMDALGFALAPLTAGGSLVLSSALKGSVNGLMTPNADMNYSGRTGWGTALGAGDTTGAGYSDWGKASTGMSREEIGDIMGGTEFGQKIIAKRQTMGKKDPLANPRSSNSSQLSREDIMALLMKLFGAEQGGGTTGGGFNPSFSGYTDLFGGSNEQ